MGIGQQQQPHRHVFLRCGSMIETYQYDAPPAHVFLVKRFASGSHKFTGKERDSESGLDNFGARYNSSQYGRFMTPDWSARPTPVPFADLANPQSLNLYSYVANNPLNLTDPTGLYICADSTR